MWRKLVYLSLGFVALGGAAWAGAAWQRTQLLNELGIDWFEASEQHVSGYQFINPLLECNIPKNPLLTNRYLPFEREVRERIDREVIKRSPGIEIAAYVRNLNNGPWFGINEYVEFSPASLLKIPVMIAYLKQAETDPDVLNRRIIFNKSSGEFNQKVPPPVPLEIGSEYTVEELIEHMIRYSDNEAMLLLMRNISSEDISRVYRDFALEPPDENASDYSITVKAYSTFFRVLYNASYLSRRYSEWSLELLSRTAFDQGLVAGLSSDLTVSHKFGERERWTGSTSRQLHDCGIVYHPRFPYLICVMTRGLSTSDLAKPIADISRIVFEEVNERYPVK